MMMLNGMGRRLWLGALAAVMAVAISAPHASAQTIEKRIDRLEKEVRAVQRKVFDGATGDAAGVTASTPAATPQQALDMERRIADLEEQLRRINGQLEELQHQSDENRQRLEAFMADAEFRFNQLEGKGGAAAAPATKPASAVEGNELPAPAAAAGVATAADGGLPAGSPMEQYNFAYSLLAQGKYEAAEKAFRAFLSAHGSDELAGNAQYWLGQSLFVRGLYEQAAREFLTGYQSYPKSPKAAAYLLKVGITLGKIGQKTDACDVFKELKSRFPNSPESKDRRPQEEKTIGCS